MIAHTNERIVNLKDCIIRKATIEDLEHLLVFARRTFIDTYAHKNDKREFEKYLKKAFNPSTFYEELDRSGSSFFLVIHNHQLIAYYKSNIGTAQTDKDHFNSLEIERIYVDSRYHGNGLGRAMIDHATKSGISGGYEYLWLGVWEENPEAIRFYARLGFAQIGRHIFNVGDEAQVDILMKLSL